MAAEASEQQLTIAWLMRKKPSLAIGRSSSIKADLLWHRAVPEELPEELGLMGLQEGGGSKPPRKKGRVEGPAAPGNGAAGTHLAIWSSHPSS